MGEWATPRPSAALSELLVPYAKVMAWHVAGAPTAMLQDLAWGISVRTLSLVPADSRPNYPCGDRQVHIDAGMELLRVEGKIELVPDDEVANTVVSPLGVVPKPHSTKWRVIHDLSILVNDSVEIRQMRLPTIENFLARVTQNAWMWKRDWKNGFQQFWVEKSSRRLLGFWWNGRVWRYCVLPFGLSSSPGDFCQFSQFVLNLLRAEGIIAWVYIDDEFGVNHLFKGACQDFSRAKEIHDFLQIEENEEKAVPPAQLIVVLGYEVDSVRMTVSIPPEKIAEVSSLCEDFASLRRTTLRQLQILIGNLVFVARVVRGGWTFMARMLPLLRVKSGSSPPILLTKAFQEDLRWWRAVLRNWSGISRIPVSRIIHLFCDASSTGFGAWWDDQWMAGRWNRAPAKRHINWKELATIKMAVRRWAPWWDGYSVVVHCDNRAAVSICSRGTSRSKPLARLMRDIFWSLSRASCDVVVRHIPGVDNVVADSLSRI